MTKYEKLAEEFIREYQDYNQYEIRGFAAWLDQQEEKKCECSNKVVMPKGEHHSNCPLFVIKKECGHKDCIRNCNDCAKFTYNNLKNRQESKKEGRSKYWDTMVDILDAQFPKGECKERGRALVALAYINMMLLGWKFNENGQPIINEK